MLVLCHNRKFRNVTPAALNTAVYLPYLSHDNVWLVNERQQNRIDSREILIVITITDLLLCLSDIFNRNCLFLQGSPFELTTAFYCSNRTESLAVLHRPKEFKSVCGKKCVAKLLDIPCNSRSSLRKKVIFNLLKKSKETFKADIQKEIFKDFSCE